MPEGGDLPEGDDKGQEARDEAKTPVRWRVADLLRGGRIAIIEHGGEEYRLRITANDKLILTK